MATQDAARLVDVDPPTGGDLWSRVERLFHDALARPATEREDFIRAASQGDEALHREVASLLHATEAPGAFSDDAAHRLADEMRGDRHHPHGLDSGTTPEDTTDSQPRAHPEHIGRYRLLEVLGDGGMGTVYLAEQPAPLPRRVALKLIRWGGAHGEPLRRFELERQAMARLSHPTIAQVFDAGTTDHGQPFIVLEYIPGLPLTEYCDRKGLDLQQRLELLIAVCDGVHHAHERGVIHRDLKPSNILVSEASARPLPKIIDFGIAKALEPWSTAAAAVTLTPLRVGSPGYMSPEALTGGGRAVDARSDVYSLGVVLYELLVGMRPFESRRVRGDRRARNPSPLPPRPSQRLRTLPARERRAIARRRCLDDRKLIRSLRGELDWIARRATHAEPDERYQTAADLAGDLGRWLSGEPVEARPPSFAYRTHTTWRRHRLAITTAFLLALAVVGFTIRSYHLQTRAENARERAEALVTSTLDELSRQLESGGRLDLLESTARQALVYYNAIPGVELAEAGRRHAVTLRQIGQILTARGDLDAAVTAYDQARKIDQARLRRQPSDASARLDLIEDLERLGVAHQARGDTQAADAWRRQAEEQHQRVPIAIGRSPSRR